LKSTSSYASAEDVRRRLAEQKYICDNNIATVVYLASRLGKPLLVEGPAGVGKTELAKVVAQSLDARLIRLQCYEGLDVSHAVYEWNYPRQLLHIRAAQEGTVSEEELFGPEFLIRRPLLEAIDSDEQVVLLIDEVDRADEEFEAFLLEILSDFQITIPELGTIKARRKPAVVLTSNRTRELHDALKRRALFHWIGHPSLEREVEIVLAPRGAVRVTSNSARCERPLVLIARDAEVRDTDAQYFGPPLRALRLRPGLDVTLPALEPGAWAITLFEERGDHTLSPISDERGITVTAGVTETIDFSLP